MTIPFKSELNEYQQAARRTLDTAGTRTRESLLAEAAIGIAEEAGEVAGLLKKHLFHGHSLDTDKLIKELGDVLWYTAAITTLAQTTLSAVAAANIDKLLKRYPAGYTDAASVARVDEAPFGPVTYGIACEDCYGKGFQCCQCVYPVCL